MDATININEDELHLLTHLHEHATGYSPADVLERQQLKAIETELNLTTAEVRKLSTYMMNFGLVGVREVSFSSSMASGAEITGIGITSFGANYIRQLQAAMEIEQPGKFKKFTLAAVKSAGAMIVPVATKVLTDYAASHLAEMGKAISSVWH